MRKLKALAFFGAFNPPTLAHLNLARFALERTGRETVVFVPSKSVYIREFQGKDFAYPDHLRLAMLRAAAETRPWMAVTDWEIRRARQPRTYETLCHLREEGTEASLLIGSDKLPELAEKWAHVREIAEEFGIVCLARGGDDCGRIIRESGFLTSLSRYILTLEPPPETREISSTRVRRIVAEKGASAEELSGLVPAEIACLLGPEHQEQAAKAAPSAADGERKRQKGEKDEA